MTGPSPLHERLALGLLLVVAFVCCLPAADAPFTYDEHAGIEDNRVVHPGARLSEALAYRYSPDQTRPLFFASLLLDADLWGMEPRGFRLTGFALHLLCGVLLYRLLKRAASGTASAAVAGTALFLLHPLQSESVLYIWGRSEVLSTLFGLVAILLALHADDPGPTGGKVCTLWTGALLGMTLALACKEEAIAVPIIFYLFWTLVEEKPASNGLVRAALLAIPAALFLLVRAILLGGIGRQVYVRSVVDNLLGQGVVTLRMLRLVLLPVGQSVDHDARVPGPMIGALAILACGGIVALSIGLGLRVRERSARLVACGLLVAASGSLLYWIVPLPDLMCERRLYLPLAGASLSLAGLLIRFPRHAHIAAWVLVLLLAPASFLRARVWADPTRLWGEAARLAPEKPRPLINLGVVAAEKGDRASALDLFSRAIRLEPRNAEALFNRGKLHLDAGEFQAAIDDLETSVDANPGLVRARINLGIARIDNHDLEGAETELRAALEIEPKNPRALTNLGEVLRATGRTGDAVTLYRAALDADPTYAHAAARLGVTLENIGDKTGAIGAYREFLVRGTTSPTDRQAVEGKIKALESAGGPSVP